MSPKVYHRLVMNRVAQHDDPIDRFHMARSKDPSPLAAHSAGRTTYALRTVLRMYSVFVVASKPRFLRN